jgi:hypothetical protein
MIRPSMRSSKKLHLFFRLTLLCLLSITMALALAGCTDDKHHTSDPKLQKIDEILAAQLPVGTTFDRVNYFLNSRGYKIEDTRTQHVVVAVIRHIDTDTLEPATARVTFHFDANDKLTTYEMIAFSEASFQQ